MGKLPWCLLLICPLFGRVEPFTKTAQEVFESIAEVAPSNDLRGCKARLLYLLKEDSNLAPAVAYFVEKIDEHLDRHADAEAFRAFIQEKFRTKKSPFMRFPSVRKRGLDQIFAATSLGPLGEPTAIDQIFLTMASYRTEVAEKSEEAYLLDEIMGEVYRIGSFGSRHELEESVHDLYSRDKWSLYFRYPRADEGLITTLFELLTKAKAEPMTDVDRLVREATKWRAHAEVDSSEERLAAKLIEQLTEIGSFGPLASIAKWAQEISDGGYVDFGPLDARSKEIFESLSGSMSEMKQALNKTYAWLEELKEEKWSPAAQLAKVTLNDLLAIYESNGTLLDFQKLVLGANAPNCDIYMQFPGISRAAVKRRYAIAGLSEPPMPTHLDRIYGKLTHFIRTLPPASDEARLATTIQKMVEKVGSKGRLITLKEMMLERFYESGRDIHLCYPRLTTHSLEKLYELVELGAPPRLTLIDQKKRESTHFLHRQTLTPQFAQLLTDFNRQLDQQGSFGDFQKVRHWAGQIALNSERVFTALPRDEQLRFLALTELEYDLSQVIEAIKTEEREKGSPYDRLLTGFLRDLETLNRQKKSFAHLQMHLKSLLTKDYDLYFKYPGLSFDDLQNFYNLVFLGPAPYPTLMDELYAHLAQYRQTQKIGKAEEALLTRIESQMRLMGSLGSLSDLQRWFEVTFANHSVFYQHPHLPQEGADHLYHLLGMGRAPEPTLIDLKVASTLDWMAHLDPNSLDHKLASKVLEHLFHEGSAGEFAKVQQWAQGFVDNNYKEIEPLP